MDQKYGILFGRVEKRLALIFKAQFNTVFQENSKKKTKLKLGKNVKRNKQTQGIHNENSFNIVRTLLGLLHVLYFKEFTE